MQERAKADALARIPEAQRASAKWEFVNDQPYYKGVGGASRITPFVDPAGGNVWRLTLPQCVFPVYHNDGAPGHLTTMLPQHPIAAGLPAQWDIPQTEMYGEPFHVPAPDEVVFEEKWDKGENFRSGCVWQVGKGRVFYFRPGHETYPIYKQAEPLRVVENAVRWLSEKPSTRGSSFSLQVSVKMLLGGDRLRLWPRPHRCERPRQRKPAETLPGCGNFFRQMRQLRGASFLNDGI